MPEGRAGFQPLLGKKIPAPRRTLAFAPVAAALGFVGWFLVGIFSGSFLAALFLGPALGVGATILLLGLPDLRRKDGQPWVSPQARPWMSLPTALVVALVLYFVVGLLVTPIEAIPVEWASYLTLAVAVVGGVAVGLLAWGPPPVARAPRDAWNRVPAEKRPWTFFPIGLVLTAFVYYGLGWALTAYAGPGVPQALIALPVALVSGFGLAYLLVGAPKPKRAVADALPKVPARARPLLFAATIVVLGPVFAFALGPFVSDLPLPHVFDLYVGLAAGYVLAAGAATLAWRPWTWSRHGEWRPDLPPTVRAALFAPVALLAGAFVLVAANVAGLPFPAALALGAAAGVLAGLAAAGGLRRIPRAPQAVRELPELVKPLVFFAVWFLVGGLVYVGVASLLFLQPVWALAAGAVVGAAAAYGAVEWPTLVETWGEQSARRARERAWKAERKERLAATASPPVARTITPAGPEPAPKKTLLPWKRK